MKTAFITGAASGIGLQIAKDFSAAGYRVAVADLNAKAAQEAAAALPDAVGLGCDVTKAGELRAALDAAGSVDVLINNAGLQHVAPIEEFPLEKYRLLLEVMLVAPFVAIQHVLPAMKARRSGRIINMASINGLVGFAGK